MTHDRCRLARHGRCDCCGDPSERFLCEACSATVRRIQQMERDEQEEMRDKLHVALARWDYAVLKSQ